MVDFVGFPKIPRLSREVIVSEKIDGTNGQIYWDETMQYMLVGSRTRWITTCNDNHGFAKWAYDNVEELRKLGPGHHFGEWWGQGIQRGYGLKEKRFSLFNVKRWEDDTVRPACCHVIPVIERGKNLDEIDFIGILNNLRDHGSYAAPGFKPAEGIVIWHSAGNILFKKTLLNDDKPKGDNN